MRKDPVSSRADSSPELFDGQASNFESLPFERILIGLLKNARLLRSIQIVNSRHPERIIAALEGKHVGTIIHAGHKTRV